MMAITLARMRVMRHRAWQEADICWCSPLADSCGFGAASQWRSPGGGHHARAPTPSTCRCADTLAINGNSRVMVADVWVGSIRAIKFEELGGHADAEPEEGRRYRKCHRQDPGRPACWVRSTSSRAAVAGAR